MIEPGNGFSLTLEETYSILRGAAIRIRCRLASAGFDGDVLIDACILCQIHLAHAATAKETQKSVLAKL